MSVCLSVCLSDPIPNMNHTNLFLVILIIITLWFSIKHMSKHGSQKCMVNKGNKMELFRNTTVIKNNYFALVPGKNGIKSRGVHFEKFSQSFKVWYDIAGESVLGPHVQQYISLTQLSRRHAVCYSCDLFCWCNP